MRKQSIIAALLVVTTSHGVAAQQTIDAKSTPEYARIRAAIDAVVAISTHDHMVPHERLRREPVGDDHRFNLRSVFAQSYYGWINPVPAWPADGSAETWWASFRPGLDNARATSFYRYLLPAFRDLYGVDFDAMTDPAAASRLNDAIMANYRDDASIAAWSAEVVENRANIELLLVDPYWDRIGLDRSLPPYRFVAPVLNVTSLVRGNHRSRVEPSDSPWRFAERRGMPMETLDDYLAVIDRIFAEGLERGVVCLKSTQAYERSLRFERVDKARAAVAFGKTAAEVGEDAQRDFEDFIFWRLVELSAEHELPFQIHTGQARVQGSNPILLVDLIQANPRTRFMLFHGGYPWVGETGVIAQRHPNVWIDSNWLATLNYTMAKRAYQEWLEAVPVDRILWGTDSNHVEGIYGAAVTTRRCLAEALTEKVLRGELREEHALRIGRRIMRENALDALPRLRAYLWRER